MGLKTPGSGLAKGSSFFFTTTTGGGGGRILGSTFATGFGVAAGADSIGLLTAEGTEGAGSLGPGAAMARSGVDASCAGGAGGGPKGAAGTWGVNGACAVTGGGAHTGGGAATGACDGGNEKSTGAGFGLKYV